MCDSKKVQIVVFVEDGECSAVAIIDRLEHDGHTYVLISDDYFIDCKLNDIQFESCEVFVTEEKIDEDGERFYEDLDDESLQEEVFKLFEEDLKEIYDFSIEP